MKQELRFYRAGTKPASEMTPLERLDEISDWLNDPDSGGMLAEADYSRYPRMLELADTSTLEVGGVELCGTHWVPVHKSLPWVWGHYIVTVEDGLGGHSTMFAEYRGESAKHDKGIWADMNNRKLRNVVAWAWRPLPYGWDDEDEDDR